MAKRKQRNNGRRYSDTEKMVARHIVQAAGGQVTEELLNQVATALNIPTLAWDTLARWIKEPVESERTKTDSAESRDQSPKLVETSQLDYQKAAAREIVEATFRRYAKQANNSILVESTEAKDAAKVMADMLKLMQLLDGMPTEIVGVTSRLVEVAKRKGLDPTKSIETVVAKMEELPDVGMLTEGSAVN